MFFRKKVLSRYKNALKKFKKIQEAKILFEKTRILNTLRHDIKTPLLAQIQTLELLLGGCFGEVPNKQKEIIKEILNSNKFLNMIVANTIFLNNYEMEKPKLNIENIDIKEQIDNCIENLSIFLKDKNQNIIIHSPKNVKLKADKKIVEKIIFNLLSSSILYGYENSNIEINIKDTKNNFVFSAKNKSIFMTKEKINSLFEEKKNLCDFNKLGMNLNLNIAKKLINYQNWNLIAESQNDNSSIFGFSIKK